MVTTPFLISSLAWSVSEAANLFLHIRSAILKTSQPMAAKPTPQKSMTETIAFPFRLLQDAYDLCRSTASNKLLRSNRRAKGVLFYNLHFYRPAQRNAVTSITVR
jgi:hypothetical protein